MAEDAEGTGAIDGMELGWVPCLQTGFGRGSLGISGIIHLISEDWVGTGHNNKHLRFFLKNICRLQAWSARSCHFKSSFLESIFSIFSNLYSSKYVPQRDPNRFTSRWSRRLFEVIKSVKPDLSDAEVQELFTSYPAQTSVLSKHFFKWKVGNASDYRSSERSPSQWKDRRISILGGCIQNTD